MDILQEGVYVTDSKRVINYWNNGAQGITGYRPQEVKGRLCHDQMLMHIDEKGTPLCAKECPLTHAIRTGEVVEREVYLIHKSGHRVPVFVRSAPVRDEKGDIIGGCEAFHDISPRITTAKRLAELERMAMLDHLTRLANRRYMEDVLDRSLTMVRETGICVGVLFMDVDHFKQVNDTFGHHIGDEVLAMVARTLQKSARAPDTLCRWGGEEFLEVVPGISCQVLPAIAERTRMLVANSHLSRDHGEMPLQVTISMGATIMKPDDTMDSLMSRVDELVYASKAAGRNRVTTDIPVLPL